MNAARPLSVTDRTRVRRHAERARTDRRELYAVLDAGMICHLGVVVDGSPVVLPTAYGRQGDTLYLHGSSANRSMHAASGQQVCVTVTHLDGLVCARSVFHNSVNYRSAMVFGVATLVTDRAQRLAGLRAVTDQLIPGGWAVTRSPSRKELAATAVLAVPLAEASVKIRRGPPADDAADVDAEVWAGQVPVTVTFGEPEPDVSVRADLLVPDHITALTARAPRAGHVRAGGG
jgi:nitroimidazol reductase NimA-like FMN-containing flavoprotein (pyridoxamine 5'-phosphate oxidase superfamily)